MMKLLRIGKKCGVTIILVDYERRCREWVMKLTI